MAVDSLYQPSQSAGTRDRVLSRNHASYSRHDQFGLARQGGGSSRNAVAFGVRRAGRRAIARSHFFDVHAKRLAGREHFAKCIQRLIM